MEFPPNRRDFLAAALPALWRIQDARPRRLPARFVGDALERAHHWMVPDPEKLHVDTKDKTGVVVIGGGIAGVVAAWRLALAGYDDFKVLELEDKAGGLARSGAIGKLTVPFGGLSVFCGWGDPAMLDIEKLGAMWRLLEAAGVELDVVPFAQAQWLPRPERAFDRRWGEFDGAADAKVFEFLNRPERRYPYREFETVTLSADLAKATPEVARFLDHFSLRRFGARPGDLAAAAVYGEVIRWSSSFRKWASDDDADRLGRLLVAPLATIGPRFLPGRMTLLVRQSPGGALVRVVNTLDATVTDIDAKAVILAVPPFAAARIAPAVRDAWAGLAIPANSPWLTSAIAVSRWPRGLDPNAQSHHTLDERAPMITHLGAPPEAVIVVHRPFPASASVPARMFLRELDLEDARDWVLRELRPIFPDIDEVATKIEMFRVAHGSIRPAPGFASSVVPTLARSVGAIHPCGGDYAAVPSYEAAATSGAAAAEAVLRGFGRKPEAWR